MQCRRDSIGTERMIMDNEKLCKQCIVQTEIQYRDRETARAERKCRASEIVKARETRAVPER